MDRNTVIETAYEEIKDSLEWTDGYKNDGNGVASYANYIEGIIAMTESILRKMDGKEFLNMDECVKQ